MKIVQLTTVHEPEDTRIFYKECISLARAGYEVVLIVPHTQREVRDGVRVVPVPIPQTRTERLFKTMLNAYRAAIEENALIYHFHDPELILIGILLKLRGKIVIYDAHEDLPRQLLNKLYLHRGTRRLLYWTAELIEWVAGRAFDAVIGATPQIANRFPLHKALTLRNLPLREELCVASPVPYQLRSPKFCYVGGITPARGGLEIIRAIGVVGEERDAGLLLAGDFNPVNFGEVLKSEPGWKLVEYFGYATRNGVRNILGASRAGLVLLHPTRPYLESQPVKLFEYMSAGLPIIASDFPIWRTLLEPCKCAIFVDPLNSAEITHAMRWILDNPDEAEEMGRRGQTAVLGELNWEMESHLLLDLYRRLLP